MLHSWQEALEYERRFMTDKQIKLAHTKQLAINSPALAELAQYAEQALQAALVAHQELEADLTRLFYAAMGQPISQQDAQTLGQIPQQNLWSSIQWLGARRMAEKKRPSEVFLDVWRVHQKTALDNIEKLLQQPQQNPQMFAVEINQICSFLANFECSPIDTNAHSIIRKMALPTVLAAGAFALGRYTEFGEGVGEFVGKFTQ